MKQWDFCVLFESTYINFYVSTYSKVPKEWVCVGVRQFA